MKGGKKEESREEGREKGTEKFYVRRKVEE